jgi:hypothetical protein
VEPSDLSLRDTKTPNPHPWLPWLLGGCGLALVFACAAAILLLVFGTFRLTASEGTVTISKFYLTTGLDAEGEPLPPTTEFRSTQETIYAIVSVSAPKPINVGVRWFQGETLIYDARDMVEGSRFFWISPPPGASFEPGQYRAEVYLVSDPVRTVEFTIIP